MSQLNKIAISIAVTTLLAGCAISPTFGEEHLINFNEAFNASNTLDPTFKLEQVSPVEFSIVVHQGKPLISDGSTRFFLLEEAAKTIASKLCGGAGSMFYSAKWRQHGEAGWVHLMGNFICSDVKLVPPKLPAPKEKRLFKDA